MRSEHSYDGCGPMIAFLLLLWVKVWTNYILMGTKKSAFHEINKTEKKNQKTSSKQKYIQQTHIYDYYYYEYSWHFQPETFNFWAVDLHKEYVLWNEKLSYPCLELLATMTIWSVSVSRMCPYYRIAAAEAVDCLPPSKYHTTTTTTRKHTHIFIWTDRYIFI